MDVENLTKQLEEAKKEGKVENKKSKFLRKKTKGEKLNKLLKEALYGEPKPVRDDMRKDALPSVPKFKKGGRAGLKGGGICKRGMNRKAVGKNS
jgi:hypothetical protein